jgi:hypothetical protein
MDERAISTTLRVNGTPELRQQPEEPRATDTTPLPPRHSWLGNYLAGLLATAIAPPFLATALTLLLYDPNAPLQAPVVGLAVSLVVWLGFASVAQLFLTIHRAHPAVYCTLHARFEILQAQMCKVRKQLQDRTDDPIIYALAEMQQYQDILQPALAPTAKTNCAQDWLGASGYIRLWELLHRAEETRFLLAPLEAVHADACFDTVRLTGSHVANRDKLLQYLRDGLHCLEKSQQPVADAHGVPAVRQHKEFRGRELLRYVRRAINTFRDERRLSLIQARNRLLRTVTLTAWVCFTILVVVLTHAPDCRSLAAAILFFLVGAIVGLFKQLHLDARAETATEDYGLTTARLVCTPCFSGLAALGGVVFMSLCVSVSAIAQSSSLPPDWGWAAVFTLTKPTHFFVAAVFGLSPHMLITRLHQATEKYKTDLRSTTSSPSAST